MINYGAAIKRIRSELGIKQTEIASKTGFSASYLSLVENGKAVPSLSALKQIADVMRVPYELVVWEAIEPPEELTPEQKQTLFLARSITNDYLQNLKKDSAKVK